MSRSSEEEVNRLVAEVQLLDATINALRSRLEVTEAALAESRMALETLRAVKSVKKGTELLIPIGAGSYVFARIDRTDRVIVGVGANVCVEKTIDESIKITDERVSRLEQVRTALYQQIAQASQRLSEAREALERRIRAKEAGSSVGGS